jgi:hypothetical protein
MERGREGRKKVREVHIGLAGDNTSLPASLPASLPPSSRPHLDDSCVGPSEEEEHEEGGGPGADTGGVGVSSGHVAFLEGRVLEGGEVGREGGREMRGNLSTRLCFVP